MGNHQEQKIEGQELVLTCECCNVSIHECQHLIAWVAEVTETLRTPVTAQQDAEPLWLELMTL